MSSDAKVKMELSLTSALYELMTIHGDAPAQDDNIARRLGIHVAEQLGYNRDKVQEAQEIIEAEITVARVEHRSALLAQSPDITTYRSVIPEIPTKMLSTTIYAGQRFLKHVPNTSCSHTGKYASYIISVQLMLSVLSRRAFSVEAYSCLPIKTVNAKQTVSSSYESDKSCVTPKSQRGPMASQEMFKYAPVPLYATDPGPATQPSSIVLSDSDGDDDGDSDQDNKTVDLPVIKAAQTQLRAERMGFVTPVTRRSIASTPDSRTSSSFITAETLAAYLRNSPNYIPLAQVVESPESPVPTTMVLENKQDSMPILISPLSSTRSGSLTSSSSSLTVITRASGAVSRLSDMFMNSMPLSQEEQRQEQGFFYDDQYDRNDEHQQIYLSGESDSDVVDDDEDDEIIVNVLQAMQNMTPARATTGPRRFSTSPGALIVVHTPYITRESIASRDSMGMARSVNAFSNDGSEPEEAALAREIMEAIESELDSISSMSEIPSNISSFDFSNATSYMTPTSRGSMYERPQTSQMTPMRRALLQPTVRAHQIVLDDISSTESSIEDIGRDVLRIQDFVEVRPLNAYRDDREAQQAVAQYIAAGNTPNLVRMARNALSQRPGTPINRVDVVMDPRAPADLGRVTFRQSDSMTAVNDQDMDISVGDVSVSQRTRRVRAARTGLAGIVPNNTTSTIASWDELLQRQAHARQEARRRLTFEGDAIDKVMDADSDTSSALTGPSLELASSPMNRYDDEDDDSYGVMSNDERGGNFL